MQAWVRGDSFAQLQFIGDRSNQEDSAEITPLESQNDCLLAVLSDGMGGHEAGEIASQIAVKTFRTSFTSFNAKSFEGRLYAAIQAANAEIARSIAERTQLRGMGCTLVGAVVSNEGLSWVSVGDSPLYLFRDGALVRLNQDHSMLPVLEKLVLEGKISREELSRHPQRNSLRSAVMGEKLELIDASPEPCRLLKGDVILCASDGLLTLSEPEIQLLLASHAGRNASDICDSLIAAVRAKARPRQDNVSVQVLRVSSTRKTASGAWRKVVAGVLLIAAIISTAGILFFGDWFRSSSRQNEQKGAVIPITPIAVDHPVLKDSVQGDTHDTPKVEQKVPEKAVSSGGKPSQLDQRAQGERKHEEGGGARRFESYEKRDEKPTKVTPSPPTSVPTVPKGGATNGNVKEENSPNPKLPTVLPGASGLGLPSQAVTGASTNGKPSGGSGVKQDDSSYDAPRNVRTGQE